MDRIEHLGFTIGRSEEMFTLTAWIRAVGSQKHREERSYDRLTFTELADVLLAELDGGRPGTALGEGWAQPSLWD